MEQQNGKLILYFLGCVKGKYVAGPMMRMLLDGGHMENHTLYYTTLQSTLATPKDN